MTTSCTPNSLLCTGISGSVVELFHNSQKYRPWCQSTFVSWTASWELFLGGRSHTGFVCFPLCVCVRVRARVHVTACLRACLNLSEFVSVCVRAFLFFFSFLGFWAALSVDSVVSFGLTAASSADKSDEIWQTGTVPCRTLPRPIVSPCVGGVTRRTRQEAQRT